MIEYKRMSNPESVTYSIGRTPTGNPCVVITTQEIDWDAKPIGQPARATMTIQEIEQLVGFCVRCGNAELFEAVRRPFSR
jgi:hypothetical protein